MGEAMELNGVSVDRDMMRAWLKAKRITLWSDWLITEEQDQNEAIDWVMSQMGSLSAFAMAATKPNDGPDPSVVLNGHKTPVLTAA